MVKQTNLNAVRSVNKLLYDIPIEPLYNGLLCNHPYYSSPVAQGADFSLLDLTDRNNQRLAKERMYGIIDTSELVRLYMLIREPYKLIWVKLCEDVLSEKDFAEYLADAWITEDNPNMDVNVKRKEAIELFRKANKKYLMTPDDYGYYCNLPEKVTMWRGVSPGRVKLGLSWTDDYDKALWFMHRFENTYGKRGKLFQVTTPKKNILAYLNTRGEAELVTDVYKIQRNITEVNF